MVACKLFFISFPFFFFFFVFLSAVSQLAGLYFKIFQDQIAEKKSVRILSKILIGDDGRVYACSDNDFFSFESNGSIAWSLHMNFKCNTDLAPVYSGLNQMLVLAENRILRVIFPRNGTKSEPELFFDPGETILGFAVSISSSSVYITVKNHGLYAYNMLRQQLWIAEPKTERFGYRLGCRKHYDNCTFDSPPAIDSCEGSIYISNNEGELYSLSLRGVYYQWIQDLSLVDRLFTVTPGNNGLVYVVFPTKSLVFALDSFSGDILWQKTVGPLAETSGSDPVIDSNSWVSIGSLDGTLYSISRTGELHKIPKYAETDSVIQIEPLLDCSGYAVYVSQTKLEGKIDRVIENYTYVSAKKPETALFSLVVPETRSIHWSQSYNSDQILGLLLDEDLQHFVLDERIVLAFVAASNAGNPFRCRTKHEKLSSSCSFAEPEHLDIYIGNERAIIWFLLFEFVTMILFAALVRFCFIFWKKRKLQGRPFSVFLDKRRLLHRKRREIDKTITKLQKESMADDSTVDKIGDLIQERENVKRKLSSTYSLGRDINESRSKDYVLPLYGGGSRSFSFRNRENESITMFQTPRDESSSEESYRDQQYSDDDDVADDEHDEDDLDRKQKGKLLIHSEGSSNDADDDESCGIIASSRRSIYLKKRSLSLTTS